MDDSGLGGIDGKYDHSVELETLKGRIMADIEAKLSQKEESLWRRGQVEIRRLQIEQQQVNVSIKQMQEQQAALNTESQKIRGVLLEVTTKFERVVNEMREVLRALPQRSGGEHPSPSPSVASTSASEVARDEHSFEPSGLDCSVLTAGEPSGAWSSVTPTSRTPRGANERSLELVQMWHSRGPGEGLMDTPCFDAEDLVWTAEGGALCTPQRATSSQEDLSRHLDTTVAAPPPPPSWRLPAVASPAPAVLSLANALPSAASLTPVQSPGFKRLHLAEHIEQQVGETPPHPERQSESSPVAVTGDATEAMRREPKLISVELAKEPGFVTLGMEVKMTEDLSLRIESIDEHGLVGRHNWRQDAEDARVRVGDCIVEANGVSNDPQGMLQECKARQRLVFKLLRGGEGQGMAKETTAHGEDLAPGNPEDEAAAVDTTKVGSPLSTRLRPEARIFVPSAQKEAAPAPPGLEGYKDAPQAACNDMHRYEGAEPAAGCVHSRDREEVKRALFP